MMDEPFNDMPSAYLEVIALILSMILIVGLVSQSQARSTIAGDPSIDPPIEILQGRTG